MNAAIPSEGYQLQFVLLNLKIAVFLGLRIFMFYIFDFIKEERKEENRNEKYTQFDDIDIREFIGAWHG